MFGVRFKCPNCGLPGSEKVDGNLKHIEVRCLYCRSLIGLGLREGGLTSVRLLRGLPKTK
jgi:hypothetical protein